MVRQGREGLINLIQKSMLRRGSEKTLGEHNAGLSDTSAWQESFSLCFLAGRGQPRLGESEHQHPHPSSSSFLLLQRIFMMMNSINAIRHRLL
jgi:hypothetical protein